MTEILKGYENVKGLIKIAEKPETELSKSDFKKLLEYILETTRNDNKKNINLFVLVKYTKSKIENIMSQAALQSSVDAKSRIAMSTGFTIRFVRELYSLSFLVEKYNKLEDLAKKNAFSRDSVCFITRAMKGWEDSGEGAKIDKLFILIDEWNKENGKVISKDVKLIIQSIKNGVELEMDKGVSSQSKNKNEINIDLIIKEYPDAIDTIKIIESSIKDNKTPNRDDLCNIREIFFNKIDDDIVTQGNLVTYFLKQIEKRYNFTEGTQLKQQKILSEIIDINPQFIKTRDVVGNYDPRIKILLKEGLVRNKAVTIVNPLISEINDDQWNDFELWVRDNSKNDKAISAKITIEYFNNLLPSK